MDTKMTILAIDDEIGPLESLKTILKPFYTVYTAGGGKPALEIIKNQDIDLVTLDLNMPDLDGMVVLREIKRLKKDVEVVIITGFGSLKNAAEAIKLGASDYILKPFNVSEILSIINGTLGKKKVYDQFGEILKDFENFSGFHANLNKIKETLKENYSILEEVKQNINKNNGGNETPGKLEMANTLGHTYENRGVDSKGHSSRVYYYSQLIAQKLKLPPKKQEVLQTTAYIYDIGKMGIEEVPQTGQRGYNTEDSTRMTIPPTMGIDFAMPIGVSSEVLDIIQHHHDPYQGGGIPKRLHYENAPVLARVICVADAFDYMVNDQPNRKALSLEAIISELKNCSGTRFDPQIVEIFLEIITEKKEKLLPEYLKTIDS